ncbi:hypothetical protein [Streptomyces sp. NPDC059597]|uniref:hypothetical protein n=1 Tax=Streptomyces sp. NPDC059597 TaxID=3346879 RepID=UPI003697C450
MTLLRPDGGGEPAASAPLGGLLGVPVWLLIVAGGSMLTCGGIEPGSTRSRPMRAYTRLMVGYGTGWVLTARVGLLVAWRGGSAGGEVWVGYQAARVPGLRRIVDRVRSGTGGLGIRRSRRPLNGKDETCAMYGPTGSSASSTGTRPLRLN